jgi:RimJ/RimL family protein N-acetyltransferase
MINPFNFENEYILENEFVQLRSLKTVDFDYLLPFSLKEPEIWKYSLFEASGESALKNYIEKAIVARQNKNEYAFIVFDKTTNSYAGTTRFCDIQLTNKSLQIGYTWYGKEFQGTNINKNCKLLLLSFAFDTLGVERVEFRADNGNERSIAAMKSLGCTIEGILKSHCLKPDGSRRDSIILSILKPAWEDKIKKNLEEKVHLVNSKMKIV